MNNSGKRKKIVLLHWNGRFGNRMFTYAFLQHYAEVFDLDIWLPSHWEGTALFANNNYTIVPDDELRLYLNQTIKELDNIDARLAAIQRFNLANNDDLIYMNPDVPEEYGKTNICIDSLCCYHSSIFRRYSRKKMIEQYFCFSDKVIQSDLYKRMEDNQGTYVIAHLRRDDIANPQNVSNQGYSVIAKTSYEQAFRKFGYDPKTVKWVTDDRQGNGGVGVPAYEDKWHYPEGSQYDENVFFSWFPDFLKMKFAKAIFRANSSFSWWAAFLSNAEVYAPRLHTRELFHQSGKELEVKFERGNHPHWMCVQGIDECSDIVIR